MHLQRLSATGLPPPGAIHAAIAAGLSGPHPSVAKYLSRWCHVSFWLEKKTNKKNTLLLQEWFQKLSRQEQYPSCSAHKDLTECLGSQTEWNISSIFFTAEKTWKITGVYLLPYFCSKALPYLKREEEIKRVLPTSFTSANPPSFPPISWTWLRFLTENLWVQHRGWEHTEGQ